MENPTVKESENKLVEAAKKVGLGGIRTQELMQQFADFFEMANRFEVEALAIEVTDEAQTEDIAKAREIRLKLKKVRVDTEKKRKELKEGIVLEGRAIDGIANIIKAVIVPTEKHLEEQEKFVENLKRERKEAVEREREKELSPYVDDITVFSLGALTDEAFNQLVETSRLAKEAVEAAEKKADEEAAKLKEENDKLKAEAAEKEKKAKKERAASKRQADERDRKIEVLRIEQEQIDDAKEAELQEERDRVTAKQKEIDDEKARIKQEAADKEAADQKILDDKAAEEKAAAMAPDKEKLSAFAQAIRDLSHYPAIHKISNEAKVYKISNDARGYLLDIAEDIEDKVRGL